MKHKLSQFNTEELDKLILSSSQEEYGLKSSTIKRSYTYWLRDEKDNRNFLEVYEDKLKKHHNKINKKKKNFVKSFVGRLFVDFGSMSYKVKIEHEEPYKVSFLEPTKDKLINSLDSFARVNGLALEKSIDNNPHVMYNIYTDLVI